MVIRWKIAQTIYSYAKGDQTNTVVCSVLLFFYDIKVYGGQNIFSSVFQTVISSVYVWSLLLLCHERRRVNLTSALKVGKEHYVAAAERKKKATLKVSACDCIFHLKWFSSHFSPSKSGQCWWRGENLCEVSDMLISCFKDHIRALFFKRGFIRRQTCPTSPGCCQYRDI